MNRRRFFCSLFALPLIPVAGKVQAERLAIVQHIRVDSRLSIPLLKSLRGVNIGLFSRKMFKPKSYGRT